MRWGVWAGSAAAIGLGAACLTLGLQPGVRSLPGPVSHAHPPRALVAPAPTTTTTPATIPLVPPVSLQIPEIGVSVPLGPALGISGFGTIEVPSGTTQPAWYEDGPAPGQTGSALILGHVDSKAGEGIFFNLRELVPGNTLSVTLANGKVDTFQVTYVAQYLKTGFPSALVYGSHGYAGLNLVTCGGVFDPATGHYLSNVVVFTKLVSV